MKRFTKAMTDSETSEISKNYEHVNTVPSYLQDLLRV